MNFNANEKFFSPILLEASIIKITSSPLGLSRLMERPRITVRIHLPFSSVLHVSGARASMKLLEMRSIVSLIGGMMILLSSIRQKFYIKFMPNQ